jgi:hypothetical protein
MWTANSAAALLGIPTAWLRTKAIWMLEKVPHSMHLVILRTAKRLNSIHASTGQKY